MSMINVRSSDPLKPMKVIDMSSKSTAAAYLGKVEASHTPEELEAVYRAIRYTKLFKQEQSLSKMDEESALSLPLPKLMRQI